MVSEKTNHKSTRKTGNQQKAGKEISRNSHERKTERLVVYEGRLNLCSNHRNSDANKDICKIRKVDDNGVDHLERQTRQ